MVHRTGIAAAGNWIIDHVKIIDRLPAEEHLALIEEETVGTGGAPYNVSVALRTLAPDLPLCAIGVVGEDADGRHILEHLDTLHIDRRYLRTTRDAPTSYTDVMTVRSTGRRTFFHNLGANALLAPADFPSDYGNLRLLHLGYLMLLPSLDSADLLQPHRTRAAAVLEQAAACGLETSVDVVTSLNPRMPEIVGPALPFTDHLIVNELEAGAIAGIPSRDTDGRLLTNHLREIAEALLRAGVRRTVVIHAPEGGFWKDTGGTEQFMPSLNLPPEFIRGTAGAGDAFCAGILFGLHEGWEATRALELGVANAAMCLSDPTTTGGLRPLDQVLALIGRFGFRNL
ncbi:MAG: carbohydrate kinase family protein [Candidatus Sumerlaeaceae bacterium]|nr:carbohydrate kinase family protein [Candidatus Sumerlaeaceae bacterium]